MTTELLTTHANAKTSIELLQTLPLQQHTKANIRKLREMLVDGQTGSLWAKKEGKGITNQEASLVMGKKKDQKGKGKNVCFGDADACIEEEEAPELKTKEEKQDFLAKIVMEIEILLQMNDESAEDGMQACHRKENEESNALFGSSLSTEICSLLFKISEELKEYMKHSTGGSPNQQSTSNFSYNTHPNSNNSNSGSVRSLLTQKLRQFAHQDFDDPECKNERVVIQGNLMRQLSKYSRGSKPMIVSRRFQDLSEPFSMQNKIVNERELQKWSKEGGRKEMKGRVHSQRTILGEINLSESHMKEKRAQKGEGGCSRCEIY